MNENSRKWTGGLHADAGKRRSELCKATDFETGWYLDWCRALQEEPRFHRKQWEYVYIIQALRERGCLAENKQGLAFAVGLEPLPSLFAKFGCRVLATDIHPESGKEKGWDNGQLCYGIESLNTRQICDDEIFRQKVSYRAVDMNDIPADIRGYDFNWSSCSFEHLGSLEKGLDFLENQLNTLKPGGWAVHTTEYNVSSNDQTQDSGDTVIYRYRDIEQIIRRLRDKGHFVEEADYSLGGLPEDYMVDFKPHQQIVHLKLQEGPYVVTSFGLIIQKKY